MARTRLKTAIVGCGKVAHLHAAALKTLPASEFVAVCGGSHPERREAFAQKYGVKAYATIDGLLQARAADVILKRAENLAASVTPELPIKGRIPLPKKRPIPR